MSPRTDGPALLLDLDYDVAVALAGRHVGGDVRCRGILGHGGDRQRPLTTTACAAALANLDIMEREGLDTRAARLEEPLAAALASLTEHPLVSEIRTGAGLLAAVQLDPALVEADASLPG